MAEKKPGIREEIKQIVTGIENSIQELFQSEKFADYLRTMSKFHNYSYNNTILIHMQMPNATRVAGFNKWKNQFGRHVKKGEKGLTIIAPTPFKKKIEEIKLDPDTQIPVLDADGNAIMEEKVVEIPLFRPVKVFDVSQTVGPPLPSLAADLTGDVKQYEAFMEALRRTSPVPMFIKPIAENMDGFFRQKDQTIAIREGMSQVQTVCAAVHEITHAMLHNREQTRLTTAAGDGSKEPPRAKDENTMEVEAESVSYTVCQYYNIDTSANSLGYIATWSKDKTLPELKASLETITKTANALITSIDRHFAEVCKERGIDLTAQQPEQNVLSAPADTLEQFAADLYDFMDHLHQAGVLKHPFTLDPKEQAIADLVTEMSTGYFDGVRDPLNYLVEHISLTLTDLTKVKAMLARLDGLGQIPDVPAAELPPDTPERFIDDLMGLIDRLYQAGLITKNFPPDNREQAKTNLVRTLHINPYIVRATLEQFINKDTGAAEAKAMLERLDKLAQSVPLKEYVYRIEGNSRTVDATGQHFIQAYERTTEGTLKPDRVLFFGTADVCASLLERLRTTKLELNDFFQISSARTSHYATKDGAELDAFVGADNKVYIGRRDHYDNRGHYIDDGGSLIYLSDNEKMFNFISGGGYSDTQAELLTQGHFTMEDYAEFDALRIGILAQFEQIKPLLFAGEPFSFTTQDNLELEPEDMLDTSLDQYPMPDASRTVDDLVERGYSGNDLLPLSRDQAAVLIEQDMTVYMVETGENPAMVFDRDDLMEQPENMMFAVTREEWEASQDFRQAVVDRMQHQSEREKAFLDHAVDCFAIYQLREDDALRDIRFEPLEWLKSKGRTVERDNYDLVYTAPLSAFASVDAALDELWDQFNTKHPADFQHHSMSVSDIIALKRDGVVTCHYCDSFGFELLADFISHKPTVAELEAQVKAGQVISLTDLADAVHREEKQKKSVVAQLKSQTTQERKKTAPKKRTKKER